MLILLKEILCVLGTQIRSSNGNIVLMRLLFIIGIDVGFEQVRYEVVEGDGQVSLCIQLRRGILERSAMLSFQTTLNTTASNDFDSPMGIYTFTPDNSVDGNDCISIDIAITDDLRLELNETFTAIISETEIDRLIVNFTEPVTTVTINDDDRKYNGNGPYTVDLN